MNDTLHYEWLIEGQVRLVRLRHNLSVATLMSYDWDTIALLDTMAIPLHVIVDVSELRSFPNLNDCLHTQHIRHPRMGYMLTVGVNRSRMMRFFLNAIGRATRVRYQDFDDLEAAIAFLEEHALLSKAV